MRLEGSDSPALAAWFREVAAPLAHTTEKRLVERTAETVPVAPGRRLGAGGGRLAAGRPPAGGCVGGGLHGDSLSASHTGIETTNELRWTWTGRGTVAGRTTGKSPGPRALRSADDSASHPLVWSLPRSPLAVAGDGCAGARPCWRPNPLRPPPRRRGESYNAGVEAYAGQDYAAALKRWRRLSLQSLPRGLRLPVWFQLGNAHSAWAKPARTRRPRRPWSSGATAWRPTAARWRSVQATPRRVTISRWSNAAGPPAPPAGSRSLQRRDRQADEAAIPLLKPPL